MSAAWHRRLGWTTASVAGAIGIVAVTGLVGCGVTPATTPAAPIEDTVALTARLKAQAERWDAAIVRKDRDAIEANMSDDFRQIDASGHVETRASFVDDLMSFDLRIDPYTVEEFDVRIYGDTALLSGRTRMTGRYQGNAFASDYRYIDIYVRRDGDWKIVSVQVTKVVP